MVTIDESIPAFSDGYRDASSAFYEQFNDVDFYVEDEEQENFYFCIIKKLFPAVRIEMIFPLRGKQNSIAHAESNQNKNRISIYILDKDFDDLFCLIQKRENIFYLDRYCIENYLAEEKALVEFILDEKPRLKSEFVFKTLNHKKLLDEIIGQLSKPFALFYIVHKLNIEHLKHRSNKPDFFCTDDDKSVLCDGKIARFCKTIKRQSEKQGVQVDVREELDKIEDTFELNKKRDFSGRHVSGQFSLYLLMHKVTKLFSLERTPDLQSFAYRLAQRCEFKSLIDIQCGMDSYIKKCKKQK